MKNKKIAITTLGCKVNHYDSAMMEEALSQGGFELVDFHSSADLYIINTCTVTLRTDYQSRQLIRRVQKRNPRAKILVTGCYAQVAPHLLAQLPGVSLILGNREKLQIADIITNYFDDLSPRVIISDITQETSFKDPAIRTFSHRTRAFLKIQDGCESFCSYCIVPYARGKYCSLEPEKVIERLFILREAGFKEVVLSGIHLSAYGVDLHPPRTLPALLKLIEQQTPLPRIRLSSLEPMDITNELIDFLSTATTICPHLHLPLQSGDDEILKRMNRPYRSGEFRKLVITLVSTIPDLCLGADVIVGFPGEQDHHFLTTYSLLEELPLSYLHVFPYSKREKTLAATFADQIPSSTITTRSEMVRRLSIFKKKYFYYKYLGKELKVLLESKRDRSSGLLKGRSRNYIPVLVEGSESLKNQEIEVEISKVEGEKVWGIRKKRTPSKENT